MQKSKQLTEITVYSKADRFPMLPDNQLALLAESIAKNGQRHPIMLWRNGEGEDMLIDGCNRLKACGLVGVELEFAQFEGTEDDVLEYINDENILRRHLKTDQAVMMHATLFPEPIRSGKDGGRKEGTAAKIAAVIGKGERRTQQLLADAMNALGKREVLNDI